MADAVTSAGGDALPRLTCTAARHLMLAAQGLDGRPRRRPDSAAVLRAIRTMAVLQIDTIHVVERSPYLVLFSRLGPYDPTLLDDLLADGRIFEYWAHEASFLPIEDYPLFRHTMLDPGDLGWRCRMDWVEMHRGELDRVLEHIRAEGEVRSADFARREGAKGGGWWTWKPEKRALESLFSLGELMIARRERFQRVYDLRERVHPTWDDGRLPTSDEVWRTKTLNAVRALGVATARWVGDYFRTPVAATAERVRELAAEGALREVEVDGLAEVGYVHPDHVEAARSAAAGRLRSRITTFLSPFDPIVWDRKRVAELFDFDYRLECYTPAPKRRYGYFVLPLLRRGRLIGRMDAKAHRSDGVFEAKAIYLEDGVKQSGALIADVAKALAELAAWHGTPRVKVTRADPPKLRQALQAAIRTTGGAGNGRQRREHGAGKRRGR